MHDRIFTAVFFAVAGAVAVMLCQEVYKVTHDPEKVVVPVTATENGKYRRLTDEEFGRFLEKHPSIRQEDIEK